MTYIERVDTVNLTLLNMYGTSPGIKNVYLTSLLVHRNVLNCIVICDTLALLRLVVLEGDWLGHLRLHYIYVDVLICLISCLVRALATTRRTQSYPYFTNDITNIH